MQLAHVPAEYEEEPLWHSGFGYGSGAPLVERGRREGGEARALEYVEAVEVGRADLIRHRSPRRELALDRLLEGQRDRDGRPRRRLLRDAGPGHRRGAHRLRPRAQPGARPHDATLHLPRGRSLHVRECANRLRRQPGDRRRRPGARLPRAVPAALSGRTEAPLPTCSSTRRSRRCPTCGTSQASARDSVAAISTTDVVCAVTES